MAGMKSIDAVRGVLEDELLELTSLVKVFSDLAGKDEPPWLWLISSRMEKVEKLIYDYITAVHEHARPVLDDLEKVTR